VSPSSGGSQNRVPETAASEAIYINPGWDFHANVSVSSVPGRRGQLRMLRWMPSSGIDPGIHSLQV